MKLSEDEVNELRVEAAAAAASGQFRKRSAAGTSVPDEVLKAAEDLGIENRSVDGLRRWLRAKHVELVEGTERPNVKDVLKYAKIGQYLRGLDAHNGGSDEQGTGGFEPASSAREAQDAARVEESGGMQPRAPRAKLRRARSPDVR